MSAQGNGEYLLEVNGLKKYFPIQRGILRRTVGWVRAVDDVSFRVKRGETLGLVGESGSGKTTVLRLIVRAVEPTAGGILFQSNGRRINVAKANSEELKAIRQGMRMVFQDPESSLNPRMTVRRIIGEPLLINGVCKTKAELDERVRELLSFVGLLPEYLSRYPYAFSGGQRQRIGIARALAMHPQLLLADEPTSALDVSVQAQILNLLLDLQKKMNLAVVFVTHDLSVIRHVSDRVSVMYLGHFVEIGGRKEIFEKPLHPYTEALFSGIPQPNPHKPFKRIILKGDIPDITRIPEGCPFHPRCNYKQAICEKELPKLAPVGIADREAACHFAGKLDLKGENELRIIPSNG